MTDAQTTVGVVSESGADERRVALVPKAVASLVGSGVAVVVESGAGERALLPDALYTEAGATIGDAWAADIVVKVAPPTADEVGKLHSGQTLIGFLAPRNAENSIGALKQAGVQAFALEAIPRISRAQAMDALSSQGNVAGYKAVLLAASEATRFFPMLTTAAGTVKPATVLVLGVGVAGLQALATAKRLGARTTGYDVRPEVADQVRSVGAQWLELGISETITAAGEGGYARELTDEERAQQQQALEKAISGFDVVITTALVPGRPAPRIITAEMVASMKPGSVIVDMAAANGGNVEGTVKDQAVVTDNGVTIIGYTDLAGRLPAQASQLYGTNLVNLLKLLTPEKDGRLVLDFDDVVQRSVTVVRDGETTWPPPPVQVSAAPAAAATAAPVEASKAKEPMSTGRRLGITAAAAAVLFVLIAISPAALQVHLTVFALAIVIGYYVIGHVHHALHTPLMSVTNAISGIIVVGALLQIGHGNLPITVLAAVAILLASINVFGGFAVTRRMLAMFSRS